MAVALLGCEKWGSRKYALVPSGLLSLLCLAGNILLSQLSDTECGN